MSNSISPRTNKIVNVVISLGAAVVLVGALAKIIHLSWADYALIVGLLTEALIFVIYAFLPPPETSLCDLVFCDPWRAAANCAFTT